MTVPSIPTTVNNIAYINEYICIYMLYFFQWSMKCNDIAQPIILLFSVFGFVTCLYNYTDCTIVMIDEFDDECCTYACIQKHFLTIMNTKSKTIIK